MPTRTRRSGGVGTHAAAPKNAADDGDSSPLSEPASEEVEDAVDTAQHASPGLRFNQSLSWRAGRPMPVADLLKRLQTLANELREMEQEENDAIKDSLGRVAKELADPQLLGHKDKGVKAWAACCSVDVLRLCAPHAPFTSKQLRSIFEMIVKSVFPALSDPSHPYNAQHMYVLASLAQVKSIVLVTDVPHANSLMNQIFTTYFDIVSGSTKASSGEQIPKAVHFNMTSILVVLVDEAQSIPQDSIDIVMAQFIRVDPRVLTIGESRSKKGAVDPKQPTLSLKELPPAYMMAKNI